MMSAKFYRPDSVIKAIQFTGDNLEEILNFLIENNVHPVPNYFNGKLYITSNGEGPIVCLELGQYDFVIQHSDTFSSLNEHKFRVNYKEI